MYKKRGVLLALAVLIFLLFAFSCNAALIFSKYIMPNDTVAVQGNKFTFMLSKDWETLYVKGNGTTNLMGLYGCRETTYYTICFNETRYNLSADQGTVDHYNQEIPQIYLKIYDKTPELKITRTIDNATLLLGEETTYNVDIKNSGNIDLYKVTFSDELPLQLQILSFMQLNKKGNAISWEGNIMSGKNKSFHYEVKAIAPFDAKTKAKLTYSYANKTKQIESSELRVRVVEPINITYGMARNNVSIYENTSFYVNFANTDPVYPVNITHLRIYIPANIIVKSYSSDLIKGGDSSYRWSKNLAKGQKAGVRLNISSIYYGMYPFKADITYVTHKTEFDKTVTKNLSFYIQRLKPAIQVSPTIIRAGADAEIRVSLTNSNTQISFNNIKCVFESEFTKNSANIYALILPETTLEIYSKNFTPSAALAGQLVSFAVNCNYRTANSQQFYSSKTINVSVRAGNQSQAGVTTTTNPKIQFGSFANNSNSVGVTKETTRVETSTTKKVSATTTINEEIPETKAGMLGLFARIGHFVRNIFG